MRDRWRKRPRWLDILIGTAIALYLVMFALLPFAWAKGCADMQRLAQEAATSMAHRNSMDHSGFHDRARRGARAENVAYGVRTRSAAVAMWWRSPGHAANMRLPGCKAVAHAVSSSGKYYWAMIIGP